MKKRFTPILGLLLMLCVQSQAQSFESATDAVKNMGVGWNLGNTLDANRQSVTDITDDQYWGQQGLESETCWGQPETTRELIHMMKEAGFGAIRIPVTWYNHMNAEAEVDGEWMVRVKQVVDYVIDEGLYCIINVHHDTGADSFDDDGNLSGYHWLKASLDNYSHNGLRYAALWGQIALTFRDYGEKLLFEGFNEMLDDNSCWNYPTWSSESDYNEEAAKDAYQAINFYNKLFVETVRFTGGNNAERNLIINPYAAASGGEWGNNKHPQEPLETLELPEDPGHLIVEVHSYPSITSGISSAKSGLDWTFGNLKAKIIDRLNVPLIVGEWGTSNVDNGSDYIDRRADLIEFCDYFVKKAKEEGIGTFYWMGLSDRIYRSEPAFNQADLAETLIKAYYGSSDNYKFPTHDSSKGTVAFEGEKTLEWGVGITVPASMLKEVGKQVEVELSYKLDFTDYDDIQFMYNKGGWQKIPSGLSMDGQAFDGADFGPSGAYGISSGDSKTSVLTFDDSAFELVASNDLIIQGHGVIMTKVVVQSPGTSGISNAIIDKNSDNAIFNLAGQRVANPTKGIYIQNGKKIVMK